MKRDYVDFFAVKPGHVYIDKRLNNWASWVKVRKVSAYKPSPIFRKAKSNAWQWHPPEYRETCDILDAVVIEREVAKLPRKQADSLRWAYVWGGSPGRMAFVLGTDKRGLWALVDQGRQMLLNRLDRSSFGQAA